MQFQVSSPLIYLSLCWECVFHFNETSLNHLKIWRRLKFKIIHKYCTRNSLHPEARRPHKYVNHRKRGKLFNQLFKSREQNLINPITPASHNYHEFSYFIDGAHWPCFRLTFSWSGIEWYAEGGSGRIDLCRISDRTTCTPTARVDATRQKPREHWHFPLDRLKKECVCLFFLYSA